MLTKNTIDKAHGILTGITSRWNPLSRTVHMLVKVNGNTIRVPIDHRQVKYMQKEHNIGSEVELHFYEGGWHVVSRIQPSCDMRSIERSQSFKKYGYT